MRWAQYDAIAALGPKAEPTDIMAFLSTWKSDSGPRGPISIDPETRDIVQTVVVNRMENVDGAMANRRIDAVPDVKDPWKIINPE